MSEGLKKIQDRLSRKNIYNQLFDMIKSGRVPGSQVMHIITSNLESESAEEIVTEVLQSIVPAIVNKYLPDKSYEKNNSLMFDITIKLLQSGRFTEESTL